MSLQFYSKNKGSIATTLLKPKQKQGTKSAELELSKSKFNVSMCFLRKEVSCFVGMSHVCEVFIAMIMETCVRGYLVYVCAHFRWMAVGH